MSYLKSNTVKQLVSLKKYMIMLFDQDRPADQKYNILYFTSGEQLFKLTDLDMKTALINEMLENPRSKATPRTLKSKITSPSPSASMRSPIHMEPSRFKKGTKPVHPPQDVDKPHLNVSTSTNTN